MSNESSPIFKSIIMIIKFCVYEYCMIYVNIVFQLSFVVSFKMPGDLTQGTLKVDSRNAIYLLRLKKKQRITFAIHNAFREQWKFFWATILKSDWMVASM